MHEDLCPNYARGKVRDESLTGILGAGTYEHVVRNSGSFLASSLETFSALPV
jgi:hypothetical protein